MLDRVARLVTGHPRATLALVGVVLACGLLLVFGPKRLSTGSLGDTEADHAQSLAEQVTGRPDDLTFVAMFTPSRADESIDDVTTAMRAALAPLRTDPRVLDVMTIDDAPTFMVSRLSNRKAGTLAANITLRGDFATALENYPAVRALIKPVDADVTCTGQLPYVHDLNKTLEADLFRSELIALPLALLILVLVFRTVVAAALPVGVGAMAVVTGIGIVFGASRVMDVAVYSINICSLIGLGVSIDYSLFLVSRYREELADGQDYRGAIVRTMCTAGRVIAFSGLAVCVGLGGLMFFAGSYLLPMGLAGAIVVALAMLFALTFLPALLVLLGPRIHALRVLGPRAKPGTRATPNHGFWQRWARAVMRHPILIGLPTLGALIALGLPFLHVRFAGADVRTLDASVEARRGYEILRKALPEVARSRVVVAVQFPTAPALTSERIDALVDFADRAASIPGVSAVESVFSGDPTLGKDELEVYLVHAPAGLEALDLGKRMTVGERTVLLYVATDATPDSVEARRIVEKLREERSVADGTLLVGGATAKDLDSSAFIRARAPRAAAFVIGVSLLILFALFRSVLLPIKAVVMTLLSMCGSFGALVWIFQDGHFGVAEPRPLEPTLPVLLFCVLFGLSMDYEVLLLSRMKEVYTQTHNNVEAVAEGLQKTAGIITSAAAIMVAVFAAFAGAHVVLVQSVGVGMALAVALDATLVRTLLVPCTMRLLGDLNWWAPRFRWPWRATGTAAAAHSHRRSAAG